MLGDGRRGRPQEAPGGKGSKHGRESPAPVDPRNVRPRTFEIGRFYQIWRVDLTVDGGGVPRYYQEYSKTWIYIDVSYDTEYVYTTNGRTTIMWWTWDNYYGRWKRAFDHQWYPRDFEPIGHDDPSYPWS